MISVWIAQDIYRYISLTLLEEYNHIILDQLEKGIIERVDQIQLYVVTPLASTDKETNLLHYMPVVCRQTLLKCA